MKSAQMFPADFDGIVAGAPAFDFNDLSSWSGWLGVITGFNNTSSGFVDEGLWSVVHDEILAQCDGIDGAIDGYVSLEFPSPISYLNLLTHTFSSSA